MKRCLLAMFCVAAGIYGQAPGTVSGRITGQGAAPVRGELTAITSGGSVQIRNAVADERGDFRIDIPAGRVLLLARAEGYAPEERQIIVRPGTANPHVAFSLSPAGSVSGRVFDETGAGVPGARVWVDYAGESRSWRLAEEAGGEPADASGNFHIPVVAQGKPFTLHAESDDRLPSSSGILILRANEMRGAVLLLSRRGAVVSGVVVDATGNPVAGAAVHLRAMPAPSDITPGQRAAFAFARLTSKDAVSAADGSYSFAAVPPGRVVVTAAAGARHAAGEALTAAGTDAVITLSLR